MEKTKLGTGLTVWLWIVLVVNVLSTITLLLAAVGSFALGLGIGYVIMCFLSVILEVVLIVGVSMMLFAHKKQGFMIIIGAAVLGLVVNIITYAISGTLTPMNIIRSLVSAVVGPAIIYFLAKKDMEDGTLA